MPETRDGSRFPPPASFREQAHIKSREQYDQMYARSVEDPEGFWAEQAERLDWIEPWSKVLDWNFDEPRFEWFTGGKLNASVNCLDRHVDAGKGDQIAIIWEGNEPSESRKITYAELLADVL